MILPHLVPGPPDQRGLSIAAPPPRPGDRAGRPHNRDGIRRNRFWRNLRWTIAILKRLALCSTVLCKVGKERMAGGQLQEGRGQDPQCNGQFSERYHRDRVFGALDRAEVAPVDLCDMRELFLRQAALPSQTTQI